MAAALDRLQMTPLRPSIGFSQMEKTREFQRLMQDMLAQHDSTHQRPQPVKLKTKTKSGTYADLDAHDVLQQLLQHQQHPPPPPAPPPQQQPSPAPLTKKTRTRLQELLAAQEAGPSSSSGSSKGKGKAKAKGGKTKQKKKKQDTGYDSDEQGGGSAGLRNKRPKINKAVTQLTTPSSLPFTSLFSGASSWI